MIKPDNPKSSKGKGIVSENTTTHGLTAKTCQNESEAMLFEQHLDTYTANFHPESNIEKILVKKLA